MDTAVLTALASATVGVVSAILSYVASRSRLIGEQSLSERSTFTKEQVDFRQELRAEVERIRVQREKEADDLREEITALRREVEALQVNVKRMRYIIDQLEQEIEQYRRILRERNIPLPTRPAGWDGSIAEADARIARVDTAADAARDGT